MIIYLLLIHNCENSIHVKYVAIFDLIYLL